MAEAAGKAAALDAASRGAPRGWVRTSSGPAPAITSGVGGAMEDPAQPASQRRSNTLPVPARALWHRQATPPCEATRLAGQYAVPLAGPEMADEDRPMVGEEGQGHGSLFGAIPGGESPWMDTGFARAGPWLELGMVGMFLCLDSARYIFDVAALRHNEHRFILAQVVVCLQSILGFASALLVTGCCEGLRGLRVAFAPKEVLRCLPISVGFSLSQAAILHAFSLGLGAAVAVALGFLYMPLCAVISRWMFSRAYGWLETHALVLLTLSILAFSELRSRALSFKEGGQGTPFLLISVFLSCLSSLLAEWVLKPKYCPTNMHRFYLQKVRLEVWGVVTSFVVLKLLTHRSTPHIFEGWDSQLTLSLSCRVVQSWMAGLLAKHLSTVAKAVIQCLSMLIVYFIGDLVYFDIGSGSPQISLLAVVVALSAFLYQMGRKSTVMELEALGRAQRQAAEAEEPAPEDGGQPPESDVQAAEAPGYAVVTEGEACSSGATLPIAARTRSDVTLYGRQPFRRRAVVEEDGARSTRSLGVHQGEDSPTYVVAGVNVLAPHEFEWLSPAEGPSSPRRARRCPRCWLTRRTALVDRAWLEQAMVYNSTLAQWLTSRTGMLAQFMCVATFILSDAGRTIVYEWSMHDTAIVQQSIVVAMSGASIVVGVIMAGFTDGSSGVRASLDIREIFRCLPVAACFSFGQTCQIYAYGVGISAVENTVIGYFYMPMSAILSRWIFRRAYSGLEWVALLLLVLSASTFVLMQKTGDSAGMNPLGVGFVLSSVVLSCLGSILAEKIMKSGHCAFYIQKVHLEVGGLIAAVAMLFVSGVVSSRPTDAFWKARDVGGGRMESGPFVAWDAKIVLALVATLLQSWLGGLVAKRLSTVTRAVAQCLSLLLIYFFGDLVVKRLPFDWPVGSMACVVALTVQVFAQAGRSVKRQHPAEASPPESSLPSAASSASVRGGEPLLVEGQGGLGS